MSWGKAELSLLLHDASITALLTNGDDSIWYDSILPAEVTEGEESTINYYRITPVEGGLNYLQVIYSVNCRASTSAKSEALATAVFNVLNRHSQDSVFFVGNVLGPIPPSDPTDNYNSPVEVLTRGPE